MNPPQVYMFPILNPPPPSLPVPSLWVVSVHQPQASSRKENPLTLLVEMQTSTATMENSVEIP